MKIGAQLYTVRDACQTLEDLAVTLTRVADMGYTVVQMSGTCAFEGEWLAEQLKKNGLTCELTHFDLPEIADTTDELVALHQKFDCPHIGIGSMPEEFRGSTESVNRFCDIIAPAAARIAELGSYFMYHNHAFEYEKAEDGRTFMEMISDRFSPDVFGFTLDTYWVKYGGYDPAEEIKRLSGRIPCVHFKDMEILADGTRRYCPVGSGVLDFPGIIAALENTGCKVAFVEQDDWFGADPFDCLKKSYDYLTSLGLK